MRPQILLLIPVLCSFAAAAQTVAPPVPASIGEPPSVAAVLHPSMGRAREFSFAMLARSSSDAATVTLPASRIAVRVDGKLVPSIKFSASPRSLIFVIDTINSSLQQLLRVRDALQLFLLQNNGHLDLPTSIVIFSDHKPGTAGSGTQSRELAHRELFAQRLAPTQDGAELSLKVQQIPLGFSRILTSQGAEGMVERDTLSLRALTFLADSQVTVPGVKLVVWISPGWPPMWASHPAPSSTFQNAAFFAVALQQAHIVLNVLNSEPVVNVRGAAFWTDGVLFPRTPVAAKTSNLALQSMALQSGGSLLGNEHTLAASLDACVQDALSLFLLTLPNLPVTASTDVHELTLETTEPGLSLRTRPSFVALPGIVQPKASN